MPADNLQLMQERRFHLWRGWLGETSVLMAAGAAAWLLTLYTHPPILAACLLIAAIGWTLFQCAGASVPGIVSWMAAAATLSVALWTPISIDVFWFPIAGLFVVGGFLLSLPAGICFLLASLNPRSNVLAIVPLA